MSTPVILVIDDSATIRKMVDSHLSQEGYRVMLAPNGERGYEMACELKPDLILLDHQLPGTTGIEVCRKIIAVPECQHIPFLISSTLRKQAYIEYMDVPNVVDSLPKPFKPELLKMAVANALETAAMIVSSQTNGTAVPEVVGETDQPAFSGDFRWLGLREVVDFLNNGRKEGMLEVETEHDRVCFFLQGGRIQGVVSASFSPERVAASLPDSLRELSPLLQFTLCSGSSTQLSGLVELMDKKMLDPRMLRTLLRHQAAVLTRYCFESAPTCFSFLPQRTPPSLFRKAPIDCCLAAILVEASLSAAEPPAHEGDEPRGWTRNTLRGQNLDRAGLSARHVQLLTHLDATPRSTQDLADRAGLDVDEAERVLEGLRLAEWVESRVCRPAHTLVALESDARCSAVLRTLIADDESGWTGNVVKDAFSFQLLLKRKSPRIVLIALAGDEELRLPEKLDAELVRNSQADVVLIVPEGMRGALPEEYASVPLLERPYSLAAVREVIDAAIPHSEHGPEHDHTPHDDAAVLEAAGVE